MKDVILLTRLFQRVSTDIFETSPVDDDEVRLVIDQIVLHPQFGVTTQYDSDIAVLKVRTPQTTFCAKEKVYSISSLVISNDYCYFIDLASMLPQGSV